jgi:hypothetical protein
VQLSKNIHLWGGEDTCISCKNNNTDNAKGWLHKTDFYNDKEKIALQHRG